MRQCITVYFRIVWSHADRNWYAYYCLPGSRKSNRNNGNKYILQCFPHEFKAFQAGKYKRRKDLSFRITIRCHSVGLILYWMENRRSLYVVSSFGILTFAMRKRTLDGAWLQSSVFQHIRQMVNSFPLEEMAPTQHQALL